MSTPTPFEALIARVRAGDQEAATEVFARYEPAIRRAIRFRMSDQRLRSAFDSADVCQSVMLSFFVRASSGEYSLDSPEHLLNLLLAMARNKLAMQMRRQYTRQRDIRRREVLPIEDLPIASQQDSPTQQLTAKEFIEEAHRRLTADETQLMQLRRDGLAWSEIEAKLGGNAEALRKQLSRALDRVCTELGLDQAG